MRQVGDLEGRALAHRFLSYMVAQGVKGEAREEAPGTFRIWVYDEDELDRCIEWFASFQRDPNDRHFDAPQLASSDEGDRGRVAEQPARPRPMAIAVEEDGIPMTLTLIAVSVAVTIASLYLPNAAPLIRYLHFSEQLGRNFPEILSGQVWRLVTPIFLHGNLWHILFNMLWLFQLGGGIERLEGRRYLLVLILALATICDVAQYLVSGPAFIGMSGVVYGLLGYAWTMGRRAPRSGYALSEQTFVFMIVWMVLCLIGLIPGVANTQHVTGLVAGILWGMVRAKRFDHPFRRAKKRS